MLTGEEGVGGAQRDVLVRADVTGHHRLLRVRGQPAVDRHHRRAGRVAPAVPPRQVPAGQHQRGLVVGHVAVDRAVPQPLQPLVGTAVDGPRGDIGVGGVGLLPGIGDTGTRYHARAGERDDTEVVGELLQRVGAVERDVGRRTDLVPEAEGVVEELAPRPQPLGGTVFREDVLAEILEDPVADEPAVRAAHRLAVPVRVPGVGHPWVRLAGLAPFGMGAVVPATVQALHLEPECRRGVPGRGQHRATGQ